MKIALIAGESSGDKLGAALIDGLDAILEQPADFIGVAGPRMITGGWTACLQCRNCPSWGLSKS